MPGRARSNARPRSSKRTLKPLDFAASSLLSGASNLRTTDCLVSAKSNENNRLPNCVSFRSSTSFQRKPGLREGFHVFWSNRLKTAFPPKACERFGFSDHGKNGEKAMPPGSGSGGGI